MQRRAALLTLLAAAGAALLTAGCGGEREFDAAGIVEEMNAEGATLTLGDPLPSTEEGVEVTVVEFAGERAGLAGGGHEEGAGAVVILEDAEAAREEFERCESSVSLICFRAANAVLRFSEIAPAEEEQIASALTALESEGG